MGRRLKSVATKILIRAAIFLAYLFVGAGVFLAIERTGEYERLLAGYHGQQQAFKTKHNITDAEMSAFMKSSEEALRGGYFTFSKTSEWNFVNAFFFSGNIVTTIGYGHIVPRAAAGRIVCMIYALIGIPLTAFFLRTVGNELTSFIFNTVKSYERRAYNREAERLEMKSAIITCFLALVMLFLGGMIFSLSEGWTYLEGFYFCFITLTTIGFGDYTPGMRRQSLGPGESLTIELAALIYYVVGLSIMSGVILSISKLIEEKTKKLDLYDPLDAIANMNIENLNHKALTKLGYKMPPGTADMLARRGTIVPAGKLQGNYPRRISQVPDDVDSPVKHRNGLSRTSLTVNNRLISNNENDVTPLPNGQHTIFISESATGSTHHRKHSSDTEDEVAYDRVDADDATSSTNPTRESSTASVSSDKEPGDNESIMVTDDSFVVTDDGPRDTVSRSVRRPKSSPVTRTSTRSQPLKKLRCLSASNVTPRQNERDKLPLARGLSWLKKVRIHPSIDFHSRKRDRTNPSCDSTGECVQKCPPDQPQGVQSYDNPVARDSSA